jgi:hypothetical protein
MNYFLLLVGAVLLLSAIYIFQRTSSNSIKAFAVLIGLIGLYLIADGVGFLPANWPHF